MENQNQFQRQIAMISQVTDLHEGRYVKQEGWEPNYIRTKFAEVSRVNLMGVIIDKQEDSLTLDDGSGKIQLRSFQNNKLLQDAQLGDFVTVIGRPREWNNAKYINVEIIAKTNPLWGQVRKERLEKRTALPEEKIKEEVQEEIATGTSLADKVMKKIQELDDGKGADVEQIIQTLGEDAEEVIADLLMKGDVFEIKPGWVKLL